MNKNNKITIGILGGMGPYASLAFMKKLLDLTQAKKDWEHLRIVMDNNPHIPSRTRAFLYNENSPVEGMVESCKKLANYPVDIILLPCNSATYFLPQVQKEIGIPILSIVEATCTSLKNKFKKGTGIVVWGGTITHSTHLYAPHLQQLGYVYIKMDQGDNQTITNIIEDIKLNNEKADIGKIRTHIEHTLKKYNCSVIILGCSEFGCIIELLAGYPIIDSDTEYAKYVIELAKENV
ncbi:MAG: aspartate/glutamate racemase family protein [Bacteroidia bacterium]|jgi:aspartate racemase|nr:aspartate/glutamate racemase family protein [Bacteroidia bacterium]MBX7262765.1 amino acid racemase [Chitinophagaceae bacterium]HNM33977.1 amino acid racemase [Chitinophagaceae bacterium]